MSTTEWIERARKGDLDTFNRLVVLHQDAAYRLAYYLLGDEETAGRIVQSVFAKAFQEMRFQKNSSFHNWLLSMVVIIYRQEVNRDGSDQGRPVLKEGISDPDQIVQSYIASLPSDQRLALALVDMEGLDYHQAAAVAGWSITFLHKLLAQARFALSQRLSGRTPALASSPG